MMKSFFNTSEVAEMLDIPASTVRFWATKFDFRGIHKTAAGHRKFSADEVERIKQIYHLVKEKGLTIEGARQRLRSGNGAIDAVSRDQELMQRLLEVRSTLVEIREELRPIDGEVWSEAPAAAVAPQALGDLACGRSEVWGVKSEVELGVNDGLGVEDAPDEPDVPVSRPNAIEQTLF